MPDLTAAPVNTVTFSERELIKSFDSTTVTISKVLKTHSTVSYGQYGQAMVKAAMIALAEKDNSSAQGDKTVILPKNRRKTPRKPYDGGAAAAVKKYIAARGHPPVADMVVAAITALKEREGSSIQAIKKYIAANYNVDAEKISSSIKKYLKTAVFVGSLIQNSGKGASGYFKLNKTSSSSNDA